MNRILSVLMRGLSFRGKLMLLIGVSGTGFAVVLAISIVLGNRSNDLLDRVHDGYYPAVAASEQLLQQLTNVQRSLQDTVAATDLSALEATSAQRAAFLQQQIFSGRATPPAELASDAEVIAFVARTPGAIGYVSAGATLPK